MSDDIDVVQRLLTAVGLAEHYPKFKSKKIRMNHIRSLDDKLLEQMGIVEIWTRVDILQRLPKPGCK